LTDKNEKENSSPNVNADEKSKSLIVDNVFIYPENIVYLIKKQLVNVKELLHLL